MLYLKTNFMVKIAFFNYCYKDLHNTYRQLKLNQIRGIKKYLKYIRRFYVYIFKLIL